METDLIQVRIFLHFFLGCDWDREGKNIFKTILRIRVKLTRSKQAALDMISKKVN